MEEKAFTKKHPAEFLAWIRGEYSKRATSLQDALVVMDSLAGIIMRYQALREGERLIVIPAEITQNLYLSTITRPCYE